ncbi:globin domain-containing protein [Corynebacterium cystitidis]|uniref:globin domain-containing protein n=1 Tax=Corynebacterium cystitidis TaxID=35757 RepID=UPI00211EE9CF|nr:globin [Corynebacterium cystitidis]
MSQSFYDQVGGDAFFSALVEGFYTQVRDDDLIEPMYPQDDWEGAELRLKWFLAQYWGGPPTFNEQRGAPMLRRRHFAFEIGEPEAQRWLELMHNSLESLEVSTEHRTALWNHMVRVAAMMINQPGQ